MRERTIRVIRFIDWRFILVMTLMIMAMTVYYLVSTSARQRDEAIELLAHKDEISAIERQEAATERQVILRQLEELQTKYDTSVRINREFVAWLRSQGYPVPDRLILSENVRLETSEERTARVRREVQQNQERKRLDNGTTNSSSGKPGKPDKSDKGDRGSGRGNGGGNDKDSKSDSGKSDGKSHGDNAGGNGKGRDK